eukprot:976148-Pelagomonas_calceolata.AAC.1
MACLVENGHGLLRSFRASLVDLRGSTPSLKTDPGYGQYRKSHPHPEGLCGELSWLLKIVCTIYCVVAVRLLAGHWASYLHSI